MTLLSVLGSRPTTRAFGDRNHVRAVYANCHAAMARKERSVIVGDADR
jgi:hypothetical protein